MTPLLLSPIDTPPLIPFLEYVWGWELKPLLGINVPQKHPRIPFARLRPVLKKLACTGGFWGKVAGAKMFQLNV